MQLYTAYAGFVCEYLSALKRAGFTLSEIRQMKPEERREFGAMALEDERRETAAHSD